MTITEKLMTEWVYSGRLLAMTPVMLEEEIHRDAEAVRQRAGLPARSTPVLTQGAKLFQNTEATTSTSQVFETPVKRGRRPKIVEEVILRGPGTVRERAKRAGVSPATICRLLRRTK